MLPTQRNANAGSITLEQWKRFLARTVVPKFQPDTRRGHKRYDVNGELGVRFVSDGKEYTRTWTLLQVSYGGMTARANNEVPIGLRLDMSINTGDNPFAARGKVTHCTGTLGGYKVGIKLEFADRT